MPTGKKWSKRPKLSKLPKLPKRPKKLKRPNKPKRPKSTKRPKKIQHKEIEMAEVKWIETLEKAALKRTTARDP